MEFSLPSLPLLKIFSYLNAFSLLQAAQVNKDWNKIASSDILWKKLCVKRWVFCEDVTPQLLGTETWKQFFHYKIWQEHTKSREKPEDFTYKEIHMKTTGFREHACYLSGCGLTRNQQDRSVVCIANPKAQISARDIHEDREDGEPQPKQLREEEEEHRELRLQNYVPEDEDLKRCQVPQAKPVAGPGQPGTLET
uniref:F-box/WD repeat-containing protein 15-like n=1 Tax=Arvicanthis niloticus TaxID=61156 RepID=UPI00148718E5|nr:F-box/WD repeat-containing protein 15-like [Arvicanthis niloticus]